MHRYTACGLRKAWLRNGYVLREPPYGPAVAVHDVAGPHRAIGLCLVDRKPRLSGSAIRFLRVEMDLSQARLARLLGVSEVRLRAWESGRQHITRPPERLLQGLYREHARGEGTVRQLVERLARLEHEERWTGMELEETRRGWEARTA